MMKTCIPSYLGLNLRTYISELWITFLKKTIKSNTGADHTDMLI